MSFLSSRGNSPPVKDPGLGIRSLRKLRSHLDREMDVLDQLEASLGENTKLAASGTSSQLQQARGDIRRNLFHMTVVQDDMSHYRVIGHIH